MRDANAAGKRFERIRVLPDPLTEYLWWEMHIAHHNAAAGEDIRVLDEEQRVELGLPGEDFWLFDDDRVALMRYDNRTFAGAVLVDDTETVRECRRVRELAWNVARPFATDSRFQRV
ncbi:MAG: DUF6879 family protein [Haloechinothrix sp.]